MTATTIVLTDGTRADGSSVTCDGCGKPMSDHDCEETKVREKKPRAKPEEKPPCPHCGGAFHFSMPGGLQNTECIMRQFYVDNGTLENPYQRLPVFTLQDLKAAVEWADDLKQPISYGRMESAAGGSGTWSSIKKAATAASGTATPKRAKKIKPAAAGEKIEDLAEEVAPATTSARPQRKSKAAATPVPITSGRARRAAPATAPVADPEPEEVVVPVGGSSRPARRRTAAQAVAAEAPQAESSTATAAVTTMTAEEKRARRKELLSRGR
jgi:hypothetical protein